MEIDRFFKNLRKYQDMGGTNHIYGEAGKQPEQQYEADKYACSICYMSPDEPVVTLCGHLYCWGCIHAWSQSVGGCRFCPVCRSKMEIEELIPVLSVCSKKRCGRIPPKPVNGKKLTKVIMPGWKANDRRLIGSMVLLEYNPEVLSYRTVMGTFMLVCIFVAITLKSYLLGG
ncbi:hypothetical protein CWI42_121020 [Ordospora colligata]|uniref:RING-type E3 ubiquitin transferase n=1 Tax=Ordospora colligata OC4 TaxID=1354746 RepID=A0A0B2UIT2_9MICR|nr:uncharacterized protein M896_121020 [Ordospora colligata OC4]KHN68880.1 hypothetical protein M896_121020 [Ordospora colligata OC4]TBU13914.1 hypothetical protein CWI40_121020 [Ordospora colligata]TBU14103.1 hypothetical protein CWI41_121020 [Ordospora colligata]TBU17772.1 hypothetical protein CWI42_121020 [Ordospora colligata]